MTGSRRAATTNSRETLIPALLDLCKVTVWRGETRVFDDLSLRIEQGEHVAILGPNGAGKTTLLKLIHRELYPVENPASRVEILGRARWNVWDLRRRIGFVSQELQQHYAPEVIAEDVVLSGFFSSVGVHGMLAGRVTRAQRDAARRALESVGLADAASRRFGQLSTGEQRRCLLARALVHEPETLVLDEPTAGLDLAGSYEVLTRLRQLARRGHSLVLVTHHPAEIPPEVGRVILLSGGRIAADGPKDEILDAALLSRVYGVPVNIAAMDGYHVTWPAPEIAET